MADKFTDLWAEACAGTLTVRRVKIHLTKGNITQTQAQELITKIAGAPVAAPISVTVPGFQVYTFEAFAEEIRSNRINEGGDVDLAWRYVPGLRDACGRWPRDKGKVIKGLDPFGLRVLRFIYNRRFDALGVGEGVRILGLFSYKDLRQMAEQGAHEKRLRQLNGPFDRGVLKEATVADASKRGLGIPVTVLDGEEVTGLLVQHYNREAFVVSSFEELESAATAPSSQGGLDLVALQKAKESGKLLQVPSPEDWEQTPEEQRLQQLLGAEYWYLGSETPLVGEDFAVMVDCHRCVQEDGSRDPRPVLEILAERLSGDGVVLTADDLWQYFDGGQPDPDAALPQRTQSVFFSGRLAEHFAGRLELPVEVVRHYFTRHHDLAEEILSRQSAARKLVRGVAQADVAIGPATVPLGSIAGILAGAIVGIIPAIVLQSGVLLPIGLIVGGAAGGLLGRFLSRSSIRGRRLGVVGVLFLGALAILGACGSLQTITLIQGVIAAQGARQRALEMGLSVPPQNLQNFLQPAVILLLSLALPLAVLIIVAIWLFRKR